MDCLGSVHVGTLEDTHTTIAEACFLCVGYVQSDLVTDYDKWQTRPLVREGAPNLQDRNFLYIINIWSWATDGAQH
jgi:hypothetical protein